MTEQRYAKRRDRLRSRIRAKRLDALLVTGCANVTYLTGFTGDSSFLLVMPQREILISDNRYTIQIAEECPGLETLIRQPGQSMIEATAGLLNRLRLSRVGIESGTTTVAFWEGLKSELKHAVPVPVEGLVEQLRAVKDAYEVAQIREAIHLAERGFEFLRASLTEAMTEREAAYELEHALRRFGAEGCSFPPIVAAGPRAALPHARPGDERIGEARLLLVDWGATTRSGYRSDLTRVLATANISPKLAKLYEVVLSAQRAGMAAIRPGVLGREVDAAARSVIEQAGLGRFFGHGLGHGIGLEIHEAPRLGPDSETPLKPGMVVTIEPGVYLPGWGGVRLEDDILVTRDGAEVLTTLGADLERVLLS